MPLGGPIGLAPQPLGGPIGPVQPLGGPIGLAPQPLGGPIGPTRPLGGPIGPMLYGLPCEPITFLIMSKKGGGGML